MRYRATSLKNAHYHTSLTSKGANKALSVASDRLDVHWA